MGQTSPGNERKHTRNQAKRMEIRTPGGKRSSNAHKSVEEAKPKEKGVQKYKEKKAKKDASQEKEKGNRQKRAKKMTKREIVTIRGKIKRIKKEMTSTQKKRGSQTHRAKKEPNNTK